MDYRNMITDYMELEMEVLKNLDIDAINEAMNLMMQAYEAKKKIYIFGNGGSSATASHYQNDFNKGISEYVDKKFNFICLNRYASARRYSNEAALSLRSRRSGTKFANPYGFAY